MCGEHGTPFSSSLSLMGSSPHVRGARRDMDPVQPAAGIIPACAGSTTGSPGRAHSRRDHPRMCGEHTKELAIGECTVGSSPHVRGARLTLSTQPPATGIIPACAGSTPLLARIRPIQQGSSPHVRGAHVAVRRVDVSEGIIPACAGSTPYVRRAAGWRWDHPRMCGEHLVRPAPHALNSGSSPHVRGALFAGQFAVHDCGIIPACAGSTHLEPARGELRGDHPRMCGEHRTLTSRL